VAADRVDKFVADSNNAGSRIKKYYEREATTIYPPVDFNRFQGESIPGDYYLIVGRQIEYKRTDIAVEAFNLLDLPLRIIGEGPELPRLKKLAKSSKIEFFGRLSDSETTQQFLGCKAVLFPQEEDFGIVPLEAMASGKPVIAYHIGGALETVVDGQTGIFFNVQTSASLAEAIRRFETMSFSSEVCREHARQFDQAVFKRQIKAFAEQSWQEHQQRPNFSSQILNSNF